MRKVYCDYCGRETEYVDSKVIYGKSYGKIYLCRNCMAYVGVHKDIRVLQLRRFQVRI